MRVGSYRVSQCPCPLNPRPCIARGENEVIGIDSNFPTVTVPATPPPGVPPSNPAVHACHSARRTKRPTTFEAIVSRWHSMTRIADIDQLQLRHLMTNAIEAPFV